LTPEWVLSFGSNPPVAALVVLEERGVAWGPFRRRHGGEGGTGLRDTVYYLFM
jgi:hypothetical protein